ncbi:PREDICTED: RING finger protein 222 [Crocodylus porosus]|uniref:RING finger protein 222 n=1 Tax=Crocodylus porosus TaxID=8502 RepID=UPI00093ADA38|nr:PREDICTED: RING finger protein 222 [Crocodylus porosus]
MSETPTSKENPPGECPVCYEKFHALKTAHRKLTCGHAFCHDCLVKYLLSSKPEGQIQNCIICPICRYGTFLYKKKDHWPPQDPELSLSPTSLLHSVISESDNTLVVPSHFVMPLQSYATYHNRSSILSDSMSMRDGLFREVHIFVISDHGMPLVEDNCSLVVRRGRAETLQSVSSRSSVGIKCYQSPIVLAVFLISIVALLAAVLPWVLLVKRSS